MDLIPWATGSLAVLFLSAFVSVCTMVYKGQLIPAATHDRIVAVMEQRITERTTEAADLKAAWQASEQARLEQDGQLTELLEIARTSDQIMRALGRRGGRDALAP